MKIITENERNKIAENLYKLYEMSKSFDMKDFKKSACCIVEIALSLDIKQSEIIRESEVSE